MRYARKPKIEMPPPEHAWDRQLEEPDKSWAAFCVYRNMDPSNRSLASVERQLKKNPRTLAEWCGRWSWVLRVRAYDAWRDRQVQEAEIAEVRAMRRRHIEFAMALQGTAGLALNKIAVAEREGKQLTLKPSEVRDLAELGLKVERLNRGEPEIIARTEIDTMLSSAVAKRKESIVHDYSRLSLEELRVMRTLALKATRPKDE